MNEKFFTLPLEKQQRVIRADYRIFSQNSYKKSPMGEVAARLTKESLLQADCYSPTSFFEMMERGFRAKMDLMRQYPELSTFVMKAFYETDPEIASFIRKSYTAAVKDSASLSLMMMNTDELRPGLNIPMMLKEMFWACEGYLWRELQKGSLNADRIEKDFRELMDFWKSVYLAENRPEEGK